MNLLGVGLPELAVIMVVAFLVLGPARAVEMARTTGRALREVRRTLNEITSAVSLDDDRPSSGPRRPNSPPHGDGPSNSGQP